jgi:hypothetical protein
VLHKLVSLNIEGLPPGGGLAAKRALIEKIFKELCPDQAETVSYAVACSFLYQ